MEREGFLSKLDNAKELGNIAFCNNYKTRYLLVRIKNLIIERIRKEEIMKRKERGFLSKLDNAKELGYILLTL